MSIFPKEAGDIGRDGIEKLNQLIPGIEIGMLGMKAGGTRRMIIPPELGYGSYTVGVIPPGSVLIFVVDMLTAS